MLSFIVVERKNLNLVIVSFLGKNGLFIVFRTSIMLYLEDLQQVRKLLSRLATDEP